MADNTEDQQRFCQVCSKPASLLCRHLEQDGSTSIAAAYCNQACQTADWKAHRKACRNSKHRRQLYRVGKILQDMIYCFRRKLYELPIQVRKSAKGKILIDWGARGGDIVWEYPNFKTLTDEEHAALLTYDACNMPASLFVDVIESLLEGCFIKIEEVMYHVNHNLQKIVDRRHVAPQFQSIFRNSPLHEVFLIKLKDKRQYILDLTGAQFGQMQPVLPLKTYTDTHTTVQYYRNPLGSQKHFSNDKYNGTSASQWGTIVIEGSDYRIWKVQKDAADAIQLTFKEVGIQETIFANSERKFEVLKQAFVDGLALVIDARIKELGGYGSLFRAFKRG